MQTIPTTPQAHIRRVLSWAVVIAGTTSTGVVALGPVAVTSWSRLSGPGPATVDEAAAFLASAGAVVLLVGVAVCLGSALLAHLPGAAGRWARRTARHVATPGARRVATLLVGASVSGVLVAGSASAVEQPDAAATLAPVAPGPSGQLHPGFQTVVLDRAVRRPPAPGWTPTRPVVRPQPATALVTSGGDGRRDAGVVVHRGDCLWDIAARHLGPGATDAEVALAWPAWHEANRAVIGDDPHRLLPGQLLRAPAPERQ